MAKKLPKINRTPGENSTYGKGKSYTQVGDMFIGKMYMGPHSEKEPRFIPIERPKEKVEPSPNPEQLAIWD